MLASIVLMNLMIGLAVSDIQELVKEVLVKVLYYSNKSSTLI